MTSQTNTQRIPPSGGVRVVLLDYWRTVRLSDDKEPIKELQRILQHNMQFGEHGYEPELDPEFLRVCLTTEIYDPDAFVSHMAVTVDKPEPPDARLEFRNCLEREAANLATYEDAHPTLVGLKDQGLRLGLISNLWTFSAGQIDNSSLSSLFEHKIYSFRVGHRKPDPEIFLEAPKLFGVRPEEILVVGDNPEADVKGALNAGMQAILLDRSCGKSQLPEVPGVRTIHTLAQLLSSFRK